MLIQCLSDGKFSKKNIFGICFSLFFYLNYLKEKASGEVKLLIWEVYVKKNYNIFINFLKNNSKS